MSGLAKLKVHKRSVQCVVGRALALVTAIGCKDPYISSVLV
jgi:hypothetical protein